MATRIRLQRHGKKGKAFYHVVIADARAKRDGKFIEKIGTYNPNTNPATVDIKFDRALHWVGVGAEMSDTARTLLSYKGILYKNHLVKGVAKGALTEEQATEKFEAWMSEKQNKIDAKANGLSEAAQKAATAKLEAEKAVNDARAKEIAAKNAPEVVEEPVAEEAEATEAVEETTATEEPAAEAKEETSSEEE